MGVQLFLFHRVGCPDPPAQSRHRSPAPADQRAQDLGGGGCSSGAPAAPAADLLLAELGVARRKAVSLPTIPAMPFSLSSSEWGAWSVAMASTMPVRMPSTSASTSSAVRDGRVDPVVAGVVGEPQVVGVTLTGDRCTPQFCHGGWRPARPGWTHGTCAAGSGSTRSASSCAPSRYPRPDGNPTG